MANEDSTREFHDELLSAYLDGELSPAERARVDERLAVDPVARQMLDELRSVSLALQSLPHEKLSEDLRPAILERMQQAAPAFDQLAKPAASPALAGGRPQFTIGRTRRGWVWAAVAVAAALVIMFVERDKERDSKLPDMAASTREGRASSKDSVAHDDLAARERQELNNEVASSSRVDLAFRVPEMSGESVNTVPPANAPPGATQTLTAPTRAMPEGALDVVVHGGETDRQLAKERLRFMFDDEVSGRGSVAQPGDKGLVDQKQSELAQWQSRENSDARFVTEMEKRASEATTMAGVAPSADKRPAAEAAKSSEGLGGIPTANEPSTSARILTSGRDDFLIVYVDVKREALQNRTIDRQLATNGIVLDTATAPSGQVTRAWGDGQGAYYQALGTTLGNDEIALRLKLAQPSETDAILVEALPAQVDGLLTALDADSDNVVGISVDELKSGGEAARASKLALVDWGKFKRLTLPDELREFSRPSGRRSAQASNGSDLLAMDTATVPSARRGGRGRGGGRGAAVGGQARGGGGGGGGAGGRGGRAPVSGQAAADQSAPVARPNEGAGRAVESTTPIPAAPSSAPAKDAGQVATDGDSKRGTMQTEPQQQQGSVGGNFGSRGVENASGGTGFGAVTAPGSTSGFGGIAAGGEVGNGNPGVGGGGFGGGMQRGFGANSGQFGGNFSGGQAPAANESYSFGGRQLGLGRARRFAIAPMGGPATGAPSDAFYKLYSQRDAARRDADGDGIAAVAGGPVTAAKPAEDSVTKQESLLGEGAPARARAQSSANQPRGGLSIDEKKVDDFKAADGTQSGTPATSSTAATADRISGDQGGLQRGERPASSQSAASGTLQVLFVFRVQPASAATTATPAPDAAGNPATSPAAADKAK